MHTRDKKVVGVFVRFVRRFSAVIVAWAMDNIERTATKEDVDFLQNILICTNKA
jgi:hypothetical protein